MKANMSMTAYLRKTFLFMGTMVILSLVIAWCISATVVSQSQIPQKARAMYYQEQGRVYVKSVRAYLEELGYGNSGVTLSRQTWADHTMIYKLTIHHEAISRLGEQEREELCRMLSDIELPEDISAVYHDFLVWND